MTYFEILFTKITNNFKHHTLFGDIEEVYSEKVQNDGKISASFWYWIQVLKLVPMLFTNSFCRGIPMFRNYLKIAVRNLVRTKTYSIINLIGLSLGFGLCTILLLYIYYELNYDRYHKNAVQIYRVTTTFSGTTDGDQNTSAASSALLASVMESEFPEIEKSVRLGFNNNIIISNQENKFIENGWIWADQNIFEIFSFSLVQGDKGTALASPNSVVISTDMASKYFGNENPIGKVITYDGTIDFSVTGVMAPIPKNSHFRGDFIAHFESFPWPDYMLENWGFIGFYTYVLVRPDFNYDDLTNKLSIISSKYISKEKSDFNVEFQLQALSDIHLSSNLRNEIGQNNNRGFVLMLSAIGLIILMSACANYINLSTAHSLTRAKEVGVRKVLGAYKIQITKQFITESIVLSMFSLGVSVIFIFLLLPHINSLLQTNVSLSSLGNPVFLMLFLMMGLVVGVISSAYPAFLMSVFSPSRLKAGTFIRSLEGRYLRKTLVIIQFTFSVILIVVTLTISKQVNYILTKNIGFDREQIVIVPMRNAIAGTGNQTIRNELLVNNAIKAITFSSNLPYQILSRTETEWEGQLEGENISIHYATVDYDFFETFNIDIVEGRSFSRDFPNDFENSFIINETAVRELGWRSPIGNKFRLSWGEEGVVIGVVKDFHFESLYQTIRPLAFSFDPERARFLSAKISTENIPETLSALEMKWAKIFPDVPFEYFFLADEFDNLYETEKRLRSAFIYFAVFAIFVACLGIFGLALFTGEHNKKEIAIRKVLGSSSAQIAFMQSLSFGKLVVSAIIIASPVSYMIMNSWLNDFAYRIDQDIGTFLLAGFLGLVISVVSICTQTIRTSLKNPVDSLRIE